MHGTVWILEQHEDNRRLAIAGLALAGFNTVDFSTPHALLTRVRQGGLELPQVAVVDARSALGWENEIRESLRARIVVLTTWPTQLAPWLTVGVSRFLLKPYSLDALVEHVDPEGPPSRAPSIAKARARMLRRRAA